MPEDAQPNEFRLNRKGNSNVPLVRTASRPRGAMRSFRGRGGRGRPAGGFADTRHHPYNNARRFVPSSAAQANAVAAHSRRHENKTYSPGPSTGSGHYYNGDQAPLPHEHTVKPQFQAFPTMSNSSDMQGVPKANQHSPSEVSPDMPHHGPASDMASVPSNSERKPHSRNRRRRPPPATPKHVMVVDLPPDCHKGAISMKNFRALWLREQLPVIALQHDIDITGHMWLDSTVRLVYKPNLKDEQNANSTQKSSSQFIKQEDASQVKLEQSPVIAASTSGTVDVPQQVSQLIHKTSHSVKLLSEDARSFSRLHSARTLDPEVRLAQTSQSGKASPIKKQSRSPSPSMLQRSLLPFDIRARDLTLYDSSTSTPSAKRRSSSVSASHLSLPVNPPMDIEIIDLTSEPDEVTTTPEDDTLGPSGSPPDHNSVSIEIIEIHDDPEPCAVSVAEKCNKFVPAYSCLSLSSGSFTVDQHGIVADRQFGRTQILPAAVTRTPHTESGPTCDPDEDLAPQITHLQNSSASSDIDSDMDQLADDEPAASGWMVGGNEELDITRRPHEKPRRLLSASDDGLYVVTMRGAVQWMSWDTPRRQHNVYLSDEEVRENVEDACLVANEAGQTYAVSAVTRKRCQIQMLPVSGGGELVPPCLHIEGPKEKSPRAKKRISTVRALTQPGMFVTGGYDHRIHLWEMPAEPPHTTWRELPIQHSSIVQSLLPIHDTSHKLATAGADCRVNIWEFASEQVVNTFKVSNSVFHLHRTPLPYCMLLEVAHRELQFEIRDYRLVPVKPTLRFGFYTKVLQSRYTRGDVNGYNFACGDREGNVRIWDIRNPANELSIVSCFPDHRAMDVAFRGGDLVACSDDFRISILNTI